MVAAMRSASARHGVVQVAGVGVQLSGLPGLRLHHMRVAMADMGDVVDRIQIAPPGVVDEPGPRAPARIFSFSRYDTDSDRPITRLPVTQAGSPRAVQGQSWKLSGSTRRSRFGSGQMSAQTSQRLSCPTPKKFAGLPQEIE